MSKKRTKYSTKFKTKLVLEALKGEKTIHEIAQANNILPKNLQNWKAIFLANAELAMEPSKAVKEYKEENKILKKKVDKYAKTVGKMTVENEWLVEKLKSLDLLTKKKLIKVQAKNISLYHQTKLLGINRNYLYYKPKKNYKKDSIKSYINKLFYETPIY